jgi:enediyne polyketide synthase
MPLQSLHDAIRASGAESAPRPAWSRTPGVRRWVRTFAVRWTAAPAPVKHNDRAVRWSTLVIQGSDDDRTEARTFESAETTDGLLVWLGTDADETSAGDLFAACRMASSENIAHLAICHGGAAVAAFARSLALERQFESVVTIERMPGAKRDDIARELTAGVDEFREVRIGRDGQCYEPCFALVSPELAADNRLAERDVVLVTGGTKGIGAECALRLGLRTGAAIVLVGRSAEHAPVVAATLARARAAGVRCSYALADVTDPEALACAVSRAARRFGPITTLVHAAGFNETQLFGDIDDADLRRIMAPKTIGFRAAVGAAGAQLRRIVTFGSILGRMGLKGETHYALANAWQSKMAEDLARDRPECRVVSLEWSIWDGAGMGHRRGSLEALARFGVDAIALDDGVDAFERLVIGGATGSLMVASRFGPPSYVALGGDELPYLPFADEVLLHYPGLELVVSTELSRGRIGGRGGFTGALGLEAMAQMARALSGHDRPAVLRASQISHPIAVPEREAVRLCLVALTGLDGCVEVAIRLETDGFATDHMRASFSVGVPVSTDHPSARIAAVKNLPDAVRAPSDSAAK